MPKSSHWIIVAIATLMCCIALTETIRNGLWHTHVLLWWTAAAIWVIAVVAQAYRSRHDQNPDENNE